MAKYCDNCGHEIEKGDKICDNCGKHFDRGDYFKKVKKIILTVFLFCALGIFGYWFFTGFYTFTENVGNPGEKVRNVIEAVKKEEFTLESSELTKGEWGAYYIEGTIKNNTDKTYDYVQVNFNLYDSEGNQIGSAWTNINSLQGKGTWKYKAVALVDNEEKIDKFELAKITGW